MTLLCLGSERVPGIGLGTRLRKEDQAAAVDSIPVWKKHPDINKVTASCWHSKGVRGKFVNRPK